MDTLTSIGLAGSIIGVAALLPQVFRVLSNKSAKGLSKWFLTLWLSEKALCLIYSIGTGAYALTLKYGLGIIGIAIICYFKFIYKKE